MSTSESVEQRLWALDIEERVSSTNYGQPILAHLIVDPPEPPPPGQWPDVLLTACGCRLDRFNHPRGWQSWPVGETPLQPQYVHCNEPENWQPRKAAEKGEIGE